MVHVSDLFWLHRNRLPIICWFVMINRIWVRGLSRGGKISENKKFSSNCSVLQVKSPVQSEPSDDRDFRWDVLVERMLVSNMEVGEYCLPVWAGTWKIMNFPFRQQKKNWDCGWENYQQDPSYKSDKFDLLQEQMDQVGLSMFSSVVSWVAAPNLTDLGPSVFWSSIRTSLNAGRTHGSYLRRHLLQKMKRTRLRVLPLLTPHLR